LGCVPLQDLDLAIGELERLMSEGRFKGVEIGTNVNGVAIGDPRFESFFAAAESLGAAVFVHALHPAGACASPRNTSQFPIPSSPNSWPDNS
jgi:aminocarboxymuconate-semialdehyde decarboxylase